MVYVYLLGLTVSNLCIMITAIPAFIDVAYGVGGCNYATFWWKVNKLFSEKNCPQKKIWDYFRIFPNIGGVSPQYQNLFNPIKGGGYTRVYMHIHAPIFFDNSSF